MIYRKATQADLEYVKQNPFELAVRGYPDMEIPDENCYTVFCEDEILGVGGLRTDFPIAIRMVEFFGYKREGLMKKYCPDKGDAFLYARIE